MNTETQQCTACRNVATHVLDHTNRGTYWICQSCGLATPDERSANEKIGKRYSVRRPGHTSYADTDSPSRAETLRRRADFFYGPGHEVFDSRTA